MKATKVDNITNTTKKLKELHAGDLFVYTHNPKDPYIYMKCTESNTIISIVTGQIYRNTPADYLVQPITNYKFEYNLK